MRLRKSVNANIIASPTGAERNDDAAGLEVQRLQTTEEFTLAATTFDFLPEARLTSPLSMEPHLRKSRFTGRFLYLRSLPAKPCFLSRRKPERAAKSPMSYVPFMNDRSQSDALAARRCEKSVNLLPAHPILTKPSIILIAFVKRRHDIIAHRVNDIGDRNKSAQCFHAFVQNVNGDRRDLAFAGLFVSLPLRMTRGEISSRGEWRRCSAPVNGSF